MAKIPAGISEDLLLLADRCSDFAPDVWYRQMLLLAADLAHQVDRAGYPTQSRRFWRSTGFRKR
jgi:hypothetical protein